MTTGEEVSLSLAETSASELTSALRIKDGPTLIANIVLVGVSLIVAGALFHPRVLRSRAWRATVTPLASIIGSGFLVAGPILADAAGSYAWLAMLLLCGLGYLYGSAIRHNILHVEGHLTALPKLSTRIEQLSDIVLSFAYFVSVAYYLNLFAAFGLRLFEIEDPFLIKIVSSSAIAAVGLVGLLGGLRALERLEVDAVGLKLSVIGGLVATLVVAALGALLAGEALPGVHHAGGLHEVEVLLGLLILVQGFETSRYLGDEYDPGLRVRTMKRAQWIATAIYVVFVFLVTRYFQDGLPAVGGETEIIDMLRPLGTAAAPLLIAAALASQSSAAVADMNGAGGLLSEATNKRLSVNLGNLVVAVAALVITWSADIFEIITFASKAFVTYYALQSLQAALSALRLKQYLDAALFGSGVLLAIAVIILAVPATA